MVVSTNFVYFQHYGREDLIAVDPSRIAASVVTGVGFLGGGAILRTGINVQGLTTAAGLWLVAAIGLSAGAGMYPVSVFATILGVLALTFLRRLERKDERLLDRKISLLFTGPAPSLSAMRSTLEERGLVVSTAEYERHVDEGRVEVTFHARVPAGAHEDLIELLEAQPGVRRVQVESLS
jgi:putative Mg2+ transporter-C (MgtC) family protein